MRFSVLFPTMAFGLMLMVLGWKQFKPLSTNISSCQEERQICQPQADSFIQVVFQPNTPEMSSVTEDVLYYLSRRTKARQWVEVSVISRSGVGVIFSKQGSRSSIQGLRAALDGNPSTPALEPVPSQEAVLVEAVQRFSDRIAKTKGAQPIYFYLVTKGTKDPQVIAKIQEICRSLNQQYLRNAHLYVIGLSPENRLPIASGFEPIGHQVEFASADYNEWKQLLRKF